MIFADLTNFKVNCSESTTNWMMITLKIKGSHLFVYFSKSYKLNRIWTQWGTCDISLQTKRGQSNPILRV